MRASPLVNIQEERDLSPVIINGVTPGRKVVMSIYPSKCGAIKQ